MVTNKILLFGAGGQIGHSLCQAVLPADWHVKALARQECDFMQPGAIGKAIQDYAPDLVINAAALTDIDACEATPNRANEINFHAVANIAGQCDTLSAPLIHLSTDYVFDGSQNHTYTTDDAMNPVNAYGKTKLLGEEAARHGLHWHVIIRTSLVFSAYGSNVLTKILRQIDTQDEVSAVTDQTANPTSAAAVAEGVIAVVAAILKGKGNGFGTFHLSGEPAVTRFEFLQAIMESYAPFTTRRPKLIPIESASITGRVPRPACTILDNSKIKDIYGVAAGDWRTDLRAAIATYVKSKLSEGI